MISLAIPPVWILRASESAALAALAVLYRGVVAVVGADARAWVLATSYTVQCSTGGLCRDRRPGGPLRSEGQTVTSSPANRAALREEENRPALPGQLLRVPPAGAPVQRERDVIPAGEPAYTGMVTSTAFGATGERAASP